MFDRINQRLVHVLLAAAALLTFCLSFLVCADVIGRVLFNSPVKGTPEIVSMSIVIICFLLAGYSVQSGGMIYTDVFSGMFGVRGLAVAQLLSAVLGGKSATVTRANADTLAAGIAAADTLDLDLRLAPPHTAPRWLLTGNQAIAIGALRGGVRFVGCYPITPATDLVEWLSPELQNLGGRLVLAEDELASINMVLGASYGGAPAMTVTSGPGLSLMVESIGQR